MRLAVENFFGEADSGGKWNEAIADLLTWQLEWTRMRRRRRKGGGGRNIGVASWVTCGRADKRALLLPD